MLDEPPRLTLNFWTGPIHRKWHDASFDKYSFWFLYFSFSFLSSFKGFKHFNTIKSAGNISLTWAYDPFGTGNVCYVSTNLFLLIWDLQHLLKIFPIFYSKMILFTIFDTLTWMTLQGCEITFHWSAWLEISPHRSLYKYVSLSLSFHSLIFSNEILLGFQKIGVYFLLSSVLTLPYYWRKFQ